MWIHRYPTMKKDQFANRRRSVQILYRRRRSKCIRFLPQPTYLSWNTTNHCFRLCRPNIGSYYTTNIRRFLPKVRFCSCPQTPIPQTKPTQAHISIIYSFSSEILFIINEMIYKYWYTAVKTFLQRTLDNLENKCVKIWKSKKKNIIKRIKRK